MCSRLPSLAAALTAATPAAAPLWVPHAAPLARPAVELAPPLLTALGFAQQVRGRKPGATRSRQAPIPPGLGKAGGSEWAYVIHRGGVQAAKALLPPPVTLFKTPLGDYKADSTPPGALVTYSDEHLSIFGANYPVKLAEDAKYFEKPFLLYRDFHDQLLKRLKAIADVENNPERIVLIGNRGVGKSATLMNAVSYCMQKQWFVFYVPNTEPFRNGSEPLSHSAEEGMFDQARLAGKVLTSQLPYNKLVVSKIKTKEAHQIDNSTTLPAGSPLMTLFDMAASAVSSLMLGAYSAFMREMELMDVPVLMAVDGINNFYSGSDYNDTEGKQIMAFNFTTVKRINEFLEGKRNLKHGAMLSAYSFSTRNSDSEILNTAMNIYQKPKSRIPLYEFVKGPPPVERTTKLVPLEVPPFTWTETRTMLQHYNEIKVLFTSGLDEQKVWLYQSTACGNPRELFQTCVMPLF